jgi:hypothetical protein
MLQNRLYSLSLAAVALLLCSPAPSLASSKPPTFTVKATNVQMGDMSSATTTYTLTSVNGFSGQVGVVCHGLDSNQVPDLILPSCTHANQLMTLPANGQVSGIIDLIPPVGVGSSSSAQLHQFPGGPVAGALAAAGLLLFGLRRHPRWPLIALLAFACLGGTTGCIGHGGLAMTHGDWGYTITATSTSGTIETTQFAVVID